MQDIIGIVEHEKELQQKQKEKIILSLRKSTAGHLVKKRNYYYWRVSENGKVNEVYLGPETHPIVQRLKKQKYLEKSKKIIQNNLIAMDKFLQSYENYDPITVSGKIGKTYEVPPDDVFEAMDLTNPKDWDEKYWKGAFLEESLIHTTSKGHKVRSKSEIIIANQLHLNNIKYRYEPYFEVDGRNLRPDFMIISPRDNEIYIWEHFGMMKDIAYRKKALEKIYYYMQKGYYPWDRLIMTFDKEDESIDSRIVSKLIELYFM